MDAVKKPESIVLPKVENLSVSNESNADSRPFGKLIKKYHCYNHDLIYFIAIPLPLPNRKPIMEEMADNLKIMIDRRSAISPSNRTVTVKEDDDFNWHEGNMFVQNWIDCTPCYGFTYRLSDGTMGVLYNDGSTMTSVNYQ